MTDETIFKLYLKTQLMSSVFLLKENIDKLDIEHIRDPSTGKVGGGGSGVQGQSRLQESPLSNK